MIVIGHWTKDHLEQNKHFGLGRSLILSFQHFTTYPVAIQLLSGGGESYPSRI